MATLSQYSYSLCRRILNAKIKGRVNNLVGGDTGDTNVERDLINSAVRIALADVDFRGTIREAVLTPNLMEDEYDYALPTDAKADRIIDLRPQVTKERGEYETYDIVPPEEFDRRKRSEYGIATILNNELTRFLRISADVEDKELTVSDMEDTNWRTFDSTSVNDSDVKVDEDDYIEGNGSIRFQTDTTDTTDSAVGIQDTAITAFDISAYLARGSAFIDAKLTTADTGIHQISLRLGSDSDNYYQVSDSNQNDCSAFVSGWNKIRFDFANKTTAGTPADTVIDYAAVFWSRDTTTTALLHLNDTDWGFDNLFLKRGKYYRLSYYSRYIWQDTDYSLSENSTHDSHALLLQNDEVELCLTKAAELASSYLGDREEQRYYAGEYQRLKGEYLMRNPSQARVLTTTYHHFGSLEPSFRGHDTSDSTDS
jgi:hypothetical protein